MECVDSSPLCAGDLSPLEVVTATKPHARLTTGASRERAHSSRHPGSLDGDKSPRESGDQSPHSKTRLRATGSGRCASAPQRFRQRIHTEFQQTVAATGRLSSTNPNLQNIPIRTEEGKRIRTHFIPQKPYTKLLTADYSQIELRIMAHLSKDKELIAAFKSGEDLHSTMASLVFGVLPSEVDPEMRRKIKAMSYGLAYGLSTYGLAAQLDISPGEATELMGKYMERFGGIQEYLKSVVKEAKKVGYTETMFGRRRYLADLNQENRVRREIAERAALNAPMQGSAADIIKFAMLNFEKMAIENGLKSRLILQVHDELIFEVAEGEKELLEGIVRKAMGNAADLSIPLEVNIGIGKTWAEAAH